ncbi:helix-turn-helix transcriptional regulator [Streptomyces sp. NPDC091281]|uniref:helix-turn-helix domain-containing protein n=1 Tax=Streptomyces sp. NPDC091281 TaxID=3365985 RepID=UPI00382B88CB
MRNPGTLGQPLTSGQIAALRLAADGYTSRQIAARLSTTEQGIHQRLKDATRRLGARSRTHAVILALQQGAIHLNELDSSDRGAA